MLRDLCCRLCLLLALLGAGLLLPAASQAATAADLPCAAHAGPAQPPATGAEARRHERAGATHAERCCHACSGAPTPGLTLAPLPPPATAMPPYRLARHVSPIPEPPHRPPRHAA